MQMYHNYNGHDGLYEGLSRCKYNHQTITVNEVIYTDVSTTIIDHEHDGLHTDIRATFIHGGLYAEISTANT